MKTKICIELIDYLMFFKESSKKVLLTVDSIHTFLPCVCVKIKNIILLNKKKRIAEKNENIFIFFKIKKLNVV